MESTEPSWLPAPGEVVTVSTLLSSARRSLEVGFCDVWLEGEVVDLKIPSSGHAYFSIGDERARLKAACFRPTLRLLRPGLSEGLAMLFRGRLTVYEPRGDLQFIVDYAEPKGEGLLRLQFEELKKRLAAEGLFAEERKRPLVPMPRAVGVVTSITGAAVRDIIQVLGRRAPWVEVLIAPTRVQGEGAGAEILAALNLVARVARVDVIIIGRGGGSSDDLSAFNDEALVRAVAACPKPVISAVGHEVDFSLTDFAADRRAPTPSAAAELAVMESGALLAKLQNLTAGLTHTLERQVLRGRARLTRSDPSRFDPLRRIEERKVRVDRLTEAGLAGVEAKFTASLRRFSDARRKLALHDPTLRLANSSARLERLSSLLNAAVEANLSRGARRVEVASSSLGNLNPLAVLERGFAVARDSRGRILRSVSQVNLGDDVTVTLHEGTLTGEVKELIGKG